MRFKMRVVFPLPRKPVIIVTGVGVMLAAHGFEQLSEERPTLCEVSLARRALRRSGRGRTFQVNLSKTRLPWKEAS
jgi:hypothetical protein